MKLHILRNKKCCNQFHETVCVILLPLFAWNLPRKITQSWDPQCQGTTIIIGPAHESHNNGHINANLTTIGASSYAIPSMQALPPLLTRKISYVRLYRLDPQIREGSSNRRPPLNFSKIPRCQLSNFKIPGEISRGQEKKSHLL